MSDMGAPYNPDKYYDLSRQLQRELEAEQKKNAQLIEQVNQSTSIIFKMEQSSAPVTDEVVEQRRGIYGDPMVNFANTALIWSGLMNTTVQPWMVPLCLVGLKLQRTTVTPDYSDNSDDIDGYMAIFRELIGDDMVEARSVLDYLEQKGLKKC